MCVCVTSKFMVPSSFPIQNTNSVWYINYPFNISSSSFRLRFKKTKLQTKKTAYSNTQKNIPFDCRSRPQETWFLNFLLYAKIVFFSLWYNAVFSRFFYAIFEGVIFRVKRNSKFETP